MQTVTHGWELDVRRGPGWLFVRLQNPAAEAAHASPLVDLIWPLLENHSTYRLVIEFDEDALLTRDLLAQLVRLCHRIRQHQGVLRICGLSPQNRKIIEQNRALDRLPLYEDVEEAVMGAGRKPR